MGAGFLTMAVCMPVRWVVCMPVRWVCLPLLSLAKVQLNVESRLWLGGDWFLGDDSKDGCTMGMIAPTFSCKSDRLNVKARLLLGGG